jgi:molybdenum cofactor synthesis domain-containing protein
MTGAPTAALLIIGDEVLSGKVDDANGPFLIRALRERGVQVVEVRVIGDDPDAIADTVEELSGRATHVFTTGGIGPTHDDKTINAVARAFGRRVVRHEELVRRIQTRYGGDLNEARLRLAEVPEGARVLLGDTDAIPVIEVANVFVLPGVPALARLCFERIADRLGGTPFFSRMLLLSASESQIADRLAAVQRDHPDVAIGSYPRFGAEGYRVKVTVDGRDAASVDAGLEALRAALDPAWLVDPEGL